MIKNYTLCATMIVSLFLALMVYQSSSNAEEQSGYVGVEACKACHEEQFESYASSVHGKNSIGRSPETGRARDVTKEKGVSILWGGKEGAEKVRGCESCHGPGDAHISQGGGKGVSIIAFDKKTDAGKKSAQCLACHEESKALSSWDLSGHKSADVSCTDCHTAHAPATTKLKAKEPDVCFACHRDIRAQFNKQSRHPVKEGLIKCSDCHDPHGSFGNKQIKADEVNELCFSCHAEKRGPYIWEHPPVAENCLTCHEAHGSNHSRLLTRKTPQLCQSCHDLVEGGHPSQPYTRFSGFAGTAPNRNKMFARSCLNCHTNIHGSNGPAPAGQLFLR